MTAVVLLVEDDAIIGRSLEQALGGAGYTVTLAADGATARTAFKRLVPDLVLLDLGLPDADGVDLCREFRASAPGTSIVVLTARQEEADVVVGLDAGADDYVTKPFRLAELLARVRAHLRRPETQTSVETLTAGDVEVDLAARRAWAGTRELALRPARIRSARTADRGSRARGDSASASWTKCGTRTGTARPRRSTSTSRPCGAN